MDTNQVVNVLPTGETVPARARTRRIAFGTYIVVRYGVSNLRPQGKGERIARVFDHTGDTIRATEWILASRRWRRGDHSKIDQQDVLRVATEADIARFQPGVTSGPKRSRGW